MKILFLSRWFPYPVNNGSKLRIHNLLRGLAKSHEVTLLSFTDDPLTNAETTVLQGICSECYTVPWSEFNPDSNPARMGFLSSTPRSLLDTYSAQMENEIRRLLTEKDYDLVIASQTTMASYYQVFGKTPAIFEELELGIFYDPVYLTSNGLERYRQLLTWLKLKAYVSRLLRSFAAITMASSREFSIFKETFPQFEKKASVIPNCIDISQYAVNGIDLQPYSLIFSGSFRYQPNYDAMLWFLNEVFLLILEQVPDACLLITGDHANLPLPHLKNVHLTGHVDDIIPLIASCSVSVVPIFGGGGTRLKIIEAMAVGTPVVSTSKGAEGLLVQNGEQLLIADEPDQFAGHVIRLLKDVKLRRRLASNARQLVEERYDTSIVIPQFLGLVEKMRMETP
jgi:glycosyltransferase involved in cell wall biosynthesis